MKFIKKAPVSVFLATTQPDISRSFYQDTLELTIVDDNDFALVFELHESELRISKVQNFTPHPFTVLDWQVQNIETAMDKLKAAGIEFERYEFVKSETGIWTAPDGTMIAWFKDPDGNVLSVSQRST